MIEIVAFVFVLIIAYCGASDVGWVWVPVFAIVSSVIYWQMRHVTVIRDVQTIGAAKTVAMIYLTQLATCAIFFAIGQGIALLFL